MKSLLFILSLLVSTAAFATKPSPPAPDPQATAVSGAAAGAISVSTSEADATASASLTSNLSASGSGTGYGGAGGDATATNEGIDLSDNSRFLALSTQFPQAMKCFSGVQIGAGIFGTHRLDKNCWANVMAAEQRDAETKALLDCSGPRFRDAIAFDQQGGKKARQRYCVSHMTEVYRSEAQHIASVVEREIRNLEVQQQADREKLRQLTEQQIADREACSESTDRAFQTCVQK